MPKAWIVLADMSVLALVALVALVALLSLLPVGRAQAEPLADPLKVIARDVPSGTAALLQAARELPEGSSPQQRLQAWRGAVVAALWDDAGLEDRRWVEEQALAVLPKAIELAGQLQDRASLGVLLAYQATAKHWQSFKPQVDKALLERALDEVRASGDATAHCLVLIRRGVSGYAFDPSSQWVKHTLAAARMDGADPVCRATAFYVTLTLNGYAGSDDNPDAARRAVQDVQEAARLVPFDQYPSLGGRLLMAREYQRANEQRPEARAAMPETDVDALTQFAIARRDPALLMPARVFKALKSLMGGDNQAAFKRLEEAMAVAGLSNVARLALAEWGLFFYSQSPATHGRQVHAAADEALKLLGPDPGRMYLGAYYEASSPAMAAVGEFKRAYEDLAALEKHKAAILLNNQIATINEANIRFDVERKELENKQLELRRNVLTGLLVLSGVVLAVVGWLLRRQVLQRRRIATLNRQLDDRNRDLEALSASRSEFLAGACHDLRQPAHALSLLTEVAASRPEAGAKVLDDIRRNTLVLADMLSALLDITQLERGDYSASIAPVGLGPLLDEVKLQYASRAAQKGLSLQVEPSDGWVTSDAYLLRRVLFNLVSNACKYTDQGTVQVRVSPAEGGTLRLQVIDTGRGIPADRQADMLRPYTRIDHAAAEEGLGIGLSIVQRATQLLGHALDIQSQPGRGTTVTVTLERCAPAPETDDQAGSVAVKAHTRVLIVEDNEDVRQALAELLASWGFEVLHAESADALARLLVDERAACPALVLVDYSIGNDDGLSVVARLRQRPGWGGLPAILVTGTVSTEIDQRARDMGVLVLLKPARPARLQRLLDRALAAPVPAAAQDEPA